MASTYISPVLPENTIKRLFRILDDVDPESKEEIINDWIVRYGQFNPIFEETDDSDKIKTFLLVRNNTDDYWQNLYLVGDSFGWDTPQHQFKKIKNTRWWCIEFERPKGARLHYMLSPNEIGTIIDEENRKDRMQNFIMDERNQEVANEGILKHSVLVYPEFNDVVEKASIPPEYTNLYLRKKLEGTRSARIATISQNDDKPEKLVVVHDGSAFSKLMEADKIIKKGVDEGRWPSIALMSLDTNIANRAREYGGRYGYPQYFKDVVIPAACHHLGKIYDPEDIVLIGSSLGAWAFLDVVMNQPSITDNLILQSCPFWWPDEEHQKYILELENRDLPPVGKCYIDVGVYETGRKPMSTYKSNKKMAEVFEKVGVEFMAREYLMGHRYNAWSWALPGALDYIFNDEKNYGPLPGRKLDY